MARSLASKTNTVTPNGQYPYGRVRDDDGTGNGTPIDEKLVGDEMQFFARMMARAGVTPNEVPDNAYVGGFQLFDSFLTMISKWISKKENSNGVAITDLNLITRAGLYSVSGDTNIPIIPTIFAGDDDGYLTVHGYGANLDQKYTHRLWGLEWRRQSTNGGSTWSPWVRLGVCCVAHARIDAFGGVGIKFQAGAFQISISSDTLADVTVTHGMDSNEYSVQVTRVTPGDPVGVSTIGSNSFEIISLTGAGRGECFVSIYI